jgi:serine/threonine protein kinase
MGSNGFTGSIPPLICCLPLQSLDLHSNYLIGNLPGCLSNASNCYQSYSLLSLSNNSFSGTWTCAGTASGCNPTYQFVTTTATTTTTTPMAPTTTRTTPIQTQSASDTPTATPDAPGAATTENALNPTITIGAGAAGGAAAILGIVGMGTYAMAKRRDKGKTLAETSSWQSSTGMTSQSRFTRSQPMESILMATTYDLNAHRVFDPTLVNTTAPLAIPSFTELQDSDFRTLEKIFEGGAGIVYRGEMLKRVAHFNESAVAIKKIKQHDDPVEGAFIVRSFQQEISTAWMLNKHPSFVAFVGYVDCPIPTTVTKWYPLGSLYDWIHTEMPSLSIRDERVEWSLQTVKNLALDIAVGLGEMHRLGIVHCDIKPANILVELTRDGLCCKITDFGIAKFITDRQLQVKLFQDHELEGRHPRLRSTRNSAIVGHPSHDYTDRIGHVLVRCSLVGIGHTPDAMAKNAPGSSHSNGLVRSASSFARNGVRRHYGLLLGSRSDDAPLRRHSDQSTFVFDGLSAHHVGCRVLKYAH